MFYLNNLENESQDLSEISEASFLDVENVMEVWDFLSFLEQLEEDRLLRSLAFMKYYQGTTRQEICRILEISERTYFRKLEFIRAKITRFEKSLLEIAE